ncbi:hypothetical protein BC941DRAFT_512378 [Chlamydoabsidia padenii]|nr:hypothetical protein BC941DRAFT_512378 [Chlamydoabsidia padenii]
MSTQGFWGLQLDPDFVHSQKVIAPFMITMATLPETLTSKKRTTLGIKVNNITYALCSLTPEKVEQQLMNLTLHAGEKVSFYIKGENSIHLTGNYINCVNGNDDDGSHHTNKQSKVINHPMHAADVEEWNDNQMNDEINICDSHEYDYIDFNNDDYYDDDNDDVTSLYQSKRSAEVNIYNEPKKRKEGISVPLPTIDNDDNHVHHLLDSVNKSAMMLHSWTKEQWARGQNERTQQFNHLHLDQEQDNPPENRRTKNSIKNVSTKKKERSLVKKKTNEEIIMEAKIMQDKRLEAKKRQEELKKERKLQEQKHQRTKEPTTRPAPVVIPSVSPCPPSLVNDTLTPPSQPSLPDGFVINDKIPGKGRQVVFGDTVGLRFLGKLMNGNFFDKNISGDLFTFTVGKGEVNRGWDLAVQGMRSGGERQVIIPSSLAQEEKRMHPDIPPNESVILDIRLMGIPDPE